MALVGDRTELLSSTVNGMVVGDGEAERSVLGPVVAGTPATGTADSALPAPCPDTTAASEAEEEARHRLAAEAGEVPSMSRLGAMLLRRGDLDGAEPHLRAAAGQGYRAAANNLGVLLHQRGYADEAAGWWRIAAVAGSSAAAHALGRHHRERGDEPALRLTVTVWFLETDNAQIHR